MAPHIRTEEHVQTAQTQMIRVCTICHTTHIYIVRLHHQNVPTHQDGSACTNSAYPDLHHCPCYYITTMALYIGTEVVYITRMAHILGQKCMHKQCRPRLDQGLHILAYRQYLYVILEDSRVNLFEFKYSDNMAKVPKYSEPKWYL